jgi:hypothetical protein
VSPGRRLLKYAALALGVALVLGVGLFAYRAFWLTSTASWPAKTFAPDAWRAAAPGQRHVFWKDLDGRRVLVGLTRAEVERLLGAPEYDRGSYVLYVVKEPDPRELSFNFWYALQVEFDATGKVTRALARYD